MGLSQVAKVETVPCFCIRGIGRFGSPTKNLLKKVIAIRSTAIKRAGDKPPPFGLIYYCGLCAAVWVYFLNWSMAQVSSAQLYCIMYSP